MPRAAERNFGFLLTSVYRSYARLFEHQSECLGLTLAQCRVLSFISRNQGTTQSHVARNTEINSMALVRILDRMQADGWIERRRDSSDRRSHCLFLCFWHS
jgi:MarR family transcriptional regulator for hemolysin